MQTDQGNHDFQNACIFVQVIEEVLIKTEDKLVPEEAECVFINEELDVAVVESVLVRVESVIFSVVNNEF